MPWSEKEMEPHFKNEAAYFWGLNESKTNQWVLKKISQKKRNIFFRGTLIPGITQVRFLSKFLIELEKNK